MNPANPDAGARRSWWAALGVVAATYVYFLIFAEFALLGLAERQGIAGAEMQRLLAALGGGGIVGALAAWRLHRARTARIFLRVALAGCALAALGALAARGGGALVAAFAATGLSLGALTVGLAATLRAATGPARLGLAIGAGTGLAYALCNLPAVFAADPRVQALGAIAVTLAALGPVGWMRTADGVAATNGEATAARADRTGAARWVVALLALVWLDSAAFYVIQHTPALREAMWSGPWTLAGNAGVHGVFALVAGLLLDAGWRRAPALAALALLTVAVAQLGGRAVLPPQWLYTAGVSLYSVVLVYVPARRASAGWAAAVFGVAGWIGSALGIGMAQDLHGVPGWFAALAVGAVAWALLGGRPVRLVALAGVLVAGGGAVPARAADDSVARGREVYVREGCLHCHSQYVRPQVAEDVLRWGPAVPLAEAKAGAPPLLGNRRQGPDLTNVGTRRSIEWNRLHLQDPRAITPGSRMPAYAYLFRGVDNDGEALLHYLASLGAERLPERLAQVQAWRPAARAPIAPARAQEIFNRSCANCHGTEGRGDGPMAWEFSVRPPVWREDGWRHVRAGDDVETVLSRIIKFGLPGSPMAGHEYLPDDVVVGLARHVQTWHKSAAAKSTE